MKIRYPMEFSLDVITYGVIVSILYLLDHKVRAAQLEGKLAQVQLENLRLQLQPHFLFNTLKTISTVVYEDPRKADAMIARLAALLRNTLSDSDEQLVPLEREMETLELYLEIMRLRFENKLQVDVCLTPEVEKALAPHLLLQPLVENAIRHGKDPASGAVAIQLTAEWDGSDIRVRVRDSGPGLPKEGIHPPPPWGTLAAVDVNTGKIRWQVPLGTTRELAPIPLPLHWGTPTLGGPLTTASGLTFIGATMDSTFHAFDTGTGRELWHANLPASAIATPVTYRARVGGRQYVVVAAGGHGKVRGIKLGDYIVAFALPEGH